MSPVYYLDKKRTEEASSASDFCDYENIEGEYGRLPAYSLTNSTLSATAEPRLQSSFAFTADPATPRAAELPDLEAGQRAPL